MNLTLKTAAPRLLAGFGTLALLSGIGLAASRPAHTAGGPVSVSVANTPLATTAADSPDKQRVQFEKPLSISLTGTQSSVTDFYTVPLGKRLVIETVSASTEVVNDTQHYSVVYAVSDASVSGEFTRRFTLVPNGAPYITGESHPYESAEGGSTVSVTLVRTETNSLSSLTVSFSGYLVDTPPVGPS